MIRPWRLAAAAVIVSIAAVSLMSHPDDPKARVPRTPYRGPGFQRGADALPGTQQTSTSSQSFPSQGIELLSWLPLGDFGSDVQSGNDCWGYVSPSGREYAIMGLSTGTGFVDITIPTSASIVAVMPGPTSLWRDIKTYQSYAYAVSEGGGGIQVFDLSQIDSGIVTQVGSVTDGGTTSSHNVAIDEESGFLYRLGGGSNGLRIYDLSNPASPTYVTSWSKRYIHDAQIVTYTSGPFAGRQIAFACSGYNGGRDQTGLDVIDVTNKSNLQDLARRFYSNAAYSHQAWLSPDRQYLYLDDELDEGGFIKTTTHVFDVADPSNPQFVSSFTNGNNAIGHNLYTKGQFIYEANYRSGLRIFDASDPINPVEVAWFDTWVGDDRASFNGLWSTYPYFPSGVVIGSDLERGLFVWWHGPPRLAFEFVDEVPQTADPAGESFTVRLSEETPGIYQSGTASLHYDTGSGWTSTSLTHLGGDLYEATFPASTCGSSIPYYLSALSTDGWAWTYPPSGSLDPAQVTSAVVHSVVLEEDFELESGWEGHLDTDTATEGKWDRMRPRGNAAQPHFDHTSEPGKYAFVTGQDPIGGVLGINDIEGGHTTLLSPIFDLSDTTEPAIGYWRWFSNDEGDFPGEDVLTVDISNDGGTTWAPVETVGPTGIEASGEWFYQQFRVADFIVPSAQIRLRFQASDVGGDSIVEAAIDDFRILDIACTSTRLDSVSPDGGSYAGGNTVTLTGAGFIDGSQLSVHFGGVLATSVQVLDQTTIQAVAPQYPYPGPQIGGGQGSFPSTAVDVTVTTDLGSDTLPDAYRYQGKR